MLKYVFFSAGLFDLIGILFELETRMVSKPMLMSSLMIYYLISSKKRSLIVLWALIFALMGDIFINFGEQGFLPGLVAFAITHICYSWQFLVQREALHKEQLMPAVGLFLFYIFFMNTISPYIGELQIPVYIFGFLICANSLFSVWRDKKTAGYTQVVAGCICFLLSDCLVGIGKFMLQSSDLDAIQMLLYIVGQFLIIEGLIFYDNEKAETNAPLSFS